MKIALIIPIIFSFLSISFAQEMNDDLEGIQKKSEQIRREIIENLNPEDVENKPQLFVRAFVNEKFDKEETRHINKILLRVSTKQVQYHMMLSREEKLKGTKKEVHIVDLSIDQKNNLYRVRADLKDLRKGTLRNHYSLKNFKRDKLYRKVAIVLEILFLSELQREEEKEDRYRKVKERGKKAKPFDSGLDAFKKRILNLKNNLMDKFSTLEKKRKKDKEQTKVSDSTKSEEDEMEPQTAQSRERFPRLKKKNPKDKKGIYEKFSWMKTGSRVQDLTSTDKFDDFSEPLIVNANIPYLSLAYGMGKYLDTKSTWFYSGEFEYGSLLKKFSETIDDYMRIQIGAGYDPQTNPAYFRFDYERESINFFNLTQTGQGLVPANNTASWANLTLGGKYTKWGMTFIPMFTYGTLVAFDTDYESYSNTSTITGSKLNGQLKIENIWKRFGVIGEYSQVNIEATGEDEVILDGWQVLVSAMYSF